MTKRNVLACLLFASCLVISGCGGEYTGENRAASSGERQKLSASGETVSGSAVQDVSAIDEKKLRYSTDTNSYYENMDDDYISGIMQIRLDGTHKKKILNAPDEDYDCHLQYVDANWLYYDLLGTDGCVLYRVPMAKDAQGYDEVRVSGTEELFRDDHIRAACWSSRDMIYENGRGKIVRYDLQNKRRSGEWNFSEFGVGEETEFDFARLKDSIIAYAQPEGIYALSGDAVSWRKCSERRTGYAHNIVQTENSVFSAEDTLTQRDDEKNIHIWKCDGKSAQSFITGDQVKQAVRGARGIEEDVIESLELTGIYANDDRLYVQMELCWDEGDMLRVEYLLFSQGENETELRYETELVAAMQSLVKYRTGRWEVWDPDTRTLEKVRRERVIVNDAKCIAMAGGKAYLSLYDHEKDAGRLGCYSLDTGQCELITKEEAQRCGLEYQTEDMEDPLLSVFDKEREGNPFTDIEGVPVQDKFIWREASPAPVAAASHT